VGVVYNCPDSNSYTENFVDLTIPMGSLSSEVRTKILTELLQVSVAQFSGGVLTSYAEILVAMNQISVTGYSTDRVITIFWGPSTPHVFGASVGISKSISMGPSTSNWSFSWSYYWQFAPEASVPFK